MDSKAESDDEVVENIAHATCALVGLETRRDMRRFQNVGTKGKVHAGRPGAAHKLFCNRDITENYVRLASGQDEGDPKLLCQTCFRHGLGEEEEAADLVAEEEVGHSSF